MKQLLMMVLACLPIIVARGGEIVVDNAGGRQPSGTASCTVESLHEALRMAREWRRTDDARCEGGIAITVRAGAYLMQAPLFLRPEDSGTEASPTVIRGEEGAVLRGDRMQRHTQLWPAEGMERMLAFNTVERTITIPAPPKDVLRQLQEADGLEMVVHQRWAIAILRISGLTARGDSAVDVSFREPESRLEFEHPWPQPVIGGERGSSSFLIRTTEQRDGVEELLVIDGASHVRLEGLTFEDTSWNRPLHRGHVPLQAGFPLVDAYKLQPPGLPWDGTLENQAWVERPVAAVTVRNARHVDFVRCQFVKLGSTALDYQGEVSDCTVEHCLFDHIGGTAIMAGAFAESPLEVHRPYTDLARRCRRLTISHNTVSHAGCEDWGAVAISCGYVSDVTISHNEVRHVGYSAIGVGWGWTAQPTGMGQNRIIHNSVSDYARQLYDAGGIYTLSCQPGSVIAHNKISQPHPAPYATNDRAFTIYLDARTDGFTIEGNTTEGRPIRREEIGYNQPGPNLIFKQ